MTMIESRVLAKKEVKTRQFTEIPNLMKHVLEFAIGQLQ